MTLESIYRKGKSMNTVKTQALIQNIIDQIKEAQLKLGYAEEAVRLYYPLESVNALLETDFSSLEELLSCLEQTQEIQSTKIGTLHFGEHKGRLEVSVSRQGTEYVCKHVETPAFLADLIRLFQENPHCSLEEVRDVFARHQADYVCEKMPEGQDFDYVLHFSEDGVDSYYYCVKMEMGHTVYHRFAPQDYKMLVE